MLALALALLPLLTQQPPPPERGSGFEFALPKGWTRKTDKANNTTVLLPPGTQGEVRVILYPLVPMENGRMPMRPISTSRCFRR